MYRYSVCDIFQIFTDKANDIISRLQIKAQSIIDQLMAKVDAVKAKQASIVTEIKENEKEFLDKVRQDSKKWNSKSLNFNMIDISLTEPSLGIEDRGRGRLSTTNRQLISVFNFATQT